MNVTSPFRVPYTVTQGYDSKSSIYASGYHHAWDMLPEPRYPTQIHIVLPARVISIQDYVKAKQIDLDTELDGPMAAYFKALGLVPKSYNGPVHCKHTYMHMLDLPIKSGLVYQEDSIGTCGNLGLVSSGGVSVPESQKGVPPYPGLHLHFEYSLHPNDTSHPFNTDKDIMGRLDPQFIFNYKNNMTIGYKKQGDGTVFVLVGNTLVPIADWTAFLTLQGNENSVIELTADQFSKFSLGTGTLFKSQ